MIKLVEAREYRSDIDGLRAIAVLSVILFHFGYLPKGYLGVDIFFVISGFLITGIIYKEISEGRFSLVNFYLRRTRRITPLALFICLVALVVGIATMLPDDLENLAQSVIATNFFSNNILQAITTRNYWDVVNEYKPLMHTWSLGVEEQYYLAYPLIFTLVGKRNLKWLLPILVALVMLSFTLYLLPFEEYLKFYLIHFRFWELAVGGIAAIALRGRLVKHKFSTPIILFLVLILCLNLPPIWKELDLLATILLTLGILITSNEKNHLSSFLLESRLMIAIGKISFSLYMWHQLLLAYSRYFLVQELKAGHLIIIFILTIILSVITYWLIEQPFRNKNSINSRNTLLILGGFFLLTSLFSFHIYFSAGVLRDVPELGITKQEAVRGMHAKYNSRIRDYDNNFESAHKSKVLIIGDSFARDWANVLLESKYAKDLEISYVEDPFHHEQIIKDRTQKADVIFYSPPALDQVQALGLPKVKLWAIGTKNFGASNGIFYNHRKNEEYYKQRTFMVGGVLQQNMAFEQEWGSRYIDFISKVIDKNGEVPVFTPTKQFISQDCRHLTRAGAQFFAQLFEDDLPSMLNVAKLNH
jgi:peptidoglycan/LPS O-acetylase OafA/YrhL